MERLITAFPKIEDNGNFLPCPFHESEFLPEVQSMEIELISGGKLWIAEAQCSECKRNSNEVMVHSMGKSRDEVIQRLMSLWNTRFVQESRNVANFERGERFRCSHCDFKTDDFVPNFCPICGAMIDIKY